MPVTLSISDFERLGRAVELLVSPLAHAAVDDWRRLANRELKDLLGADSAGFMIPTATGPSFLSEEHDPAELARYPDVAPPDLSDGRPIWPRLLELGATSLAEAYGPDLKSYLRSPYYNEYAAPSRAHDTLAMAVAFEGDGIANTATLQVWHATEKGRKFGERELGILKVLLPAFRAGVTTQQRFAGQQTRLFAMMDTLGHAVRVCDAAGRRLHRSRALCELLAADPERDLIIAAIDSAVAQARAALGGTPLLTPPPTGAFSSEVRTGIAGYRVTVSLHRNVAPDEPLLLAVVDRTTPLPMSTEELCACFGLTKAEARVAALIGRGLSNAEIATQLYISPHTARRHTERILLKLQVRSRAEVPGKILR